jgi:hypothetical protein
MRIANNVACAFFDALPLMHCLMDALLHGRIARQRHGQTCWPTLLRRAASGLRAWVEQLPLQQRSRQAHPLF